MLRVLRTGSVVLSGLVLLVTTTGGCPAEVPVTAVIEGDAAVEVNGIGNIEDLENLEALGFPFLAAYLEADAAHEDACHAEAGCFELVLPVTFGLPDGSELTIAEEEDWEALDAWYEAYPDSEAEPELLYAVEIEYPDGAVVALENRADLEQAEAACDAAEEEVDEDKDPSEDDDSEDDED